MDSHRPCLTLDAAGFLLSSCSSPVCMMKHNQKQSTLSPCAPRSSRIRQFLGSNKSLSCTYNSLGLPVGTTEPVELLLKPFVVVVTALIRHAEQSSSAVLYKKKYNSNIRPPCLWNVCTCMCIFPYPKKKKETFILIMSEAHEAAMKCFWLHHAST